MGERETIEANREQYESLQSICDDFCPEGVDFCAWFRAELADLKNLRRIVYEGIEISQAPTEPDGSGLESVTAGEGQSLGGAAMALLESVTDPKALRLLQETLTGGMASKPAPRPDNSVAFLDEDLLCDDAY